VLNLFVLSRKEHIVSLKEASWLTGIWKPIAVAVGSKLIIKTVSEDHPHDSEDSAHPGAQRLIFTSQGIILFVLARRVVASAPLPGKGDGGIGDDLNAPLIPVKQQAATDTWTTPIAEWSPGT
jgi:hypothetical protein